jgi:multiple sugar transport system substrate-binding protein
VKRTAAALIGLILVSAAFAGGSRETVVEKPVLTVIGPWSGPEMEGFMPVIRAFEEEEDVSVKYRIYRAEDLSSILPIQAQAEQAPGDVIVMFDWWVQENADYTVDLSDVWNPVESLFIAPALKEGSKVLSVPFSMVVKPGFWYRKSFFEEHGLEIPSTWEEFTSLLRQIGGISGIKAPIVTGNGVGWPITDVAEHFIIALGGAQLHKDLVSGNASFTGPELKRVFDDYLIPLLEAGAFSDPVEWTQGVELWWSGDYALYFMGNWITGMVEDPDDLGVFALPGTTALTGGPDRFFIPRYSENVETAKKLLAFLISEEGQSIRAGGGGKLMPRTDVPVTAYRPADQSLVRVTSEVEEIILDLDDTIGGDWQRLFWDQIKLLWVEPESADEILRKLQDAR